MQLEERTRPAMHNDEWQRVWPVAWYVDEMDAEAVDGGEEVSEAVKRRFLPAPVAGVAPISTSSLR
jgi:hypothetical protein